MGRSVSFPDRELERSKASCTLSCSSSCDLTIQRATDPEAVPSLCRVNSLEDPFETQHTHERPDSSCVTGHRTLSSENDLIMVEKTCRVKQDLETDDRSESRVRWDELTLINGSEQDVGLGAWVCGGHPSGSPEETENGQLNLVKNLREKFQHLSSCT